MRLSITTHLLALLPLLHAATVQPSPKRGLVYIPDADDPADLALLLPPTSPLTWYYNYQASPSAALSPHPSLHFVPMLWGAPASDSDNSFLTTVTALIAAGANISYVMSFNEPDGALATGGSAISPQLAAAAWIRVVEPLRKLGVKLVAPATTGGPGGFVWLAAFFEACAGACTVDVMPVHWYGNFEGLASHIGQKRGVYPNYTTWVTEYALNDQPLAATQDFFNTSAEYFDRLDYVTHYSYFGAFRSSVSNVGPNAAMLTQDGALTDIGSWYIGGNATGNVPTGGPGKKSGSGRIAGGGVGGWAAVAGLVGAVSAVLL